MKASKIPRMSMENKLPMFTMRSSIKKYWKQSLNLTRNYLLIQDYQMFKQVKYKLQPHLKVIIQQDQDLGAHLELKNIIISQG